MSGLKREQSTPFWPSLRHQYELSQQQEMSSLGPPPFQRASVYINYFDSSSPKKRSFEELKQGGILEKAKLLEEPSIDRISTSTCDNSRKASRLPTRQLHKDFNPFLCQPFVACCCGYPCCGIPRVCQGSFKSIHDSEGAYLQALNNILLPNFARIAYERENRNGEGSTKSYGGLIAGKPAKILFPGISEEGKVSEGRNLSHAINENSVRRVKSTPGQPQPTKNNLKMDEEELKNRRKFWECSAQKRKLKTTSEKEKHEGDKGKRFKPELVLNKNGDNTKSSWQGFMSTVYIDKPITQSPKVDLTPNQKDVPIVVSKEPGVFGLRSKENDALKRHSSEPETLSSTSKTLKGVKLENSDTQVFEGGKKRHQQPLSVTKPPNLEMYRSAKNKPVSSTQSSTNRSGAFISLDSTKSSFLTLMNKIRSQSNSDVIACPYCCRTFSKYSDLKTHVEVHEEMRTSAVHNVTEERGRRGEMLPSTSGRTSATPQFFSFESQGDESSKRATSVIMFAGQKKD